MSPELNVLGSLCNQTDNQQTDVKTLHYSLLKLKYSPSIQKRLKKIRIHRNHILNRISTKKSSSRLIILCVLRDACLEIFFVFVNFYASGTQGEEVTESLGFVKN